jgi:four helix bundle protein
MYQIAKELPVEEKYGLVSQVRRAAVSLTNNIAEGHGRYHFLDQIKFCLHARGSLEELIDDLNVCEDEKYVESGPLSNLREQAWRVHRLLNGYIRFLRTRIEQNSPRVQETFNDEIVGDVEDALSNRFNPSSLQPFNE